MKRLQEVLDNEASRLAGLDLFTLQVKTWELDKS